MKLGQVIRVSCGVLFILAGAVIYLVPNVREARTQNEVDVIVEEMQDLQDEYEKEVAKQETVQSAESDSNAVQQVEEISPYTYKHVYPELYASLEAYNESLRTGQVVEDAWAYKNSSVDISELGSDAIGYIEIPDMKVRLPLYLGSSEENLAKGAAVVNGTSMPIGGESTNCVIAGHRGWRGSAYFQFIENMGIGSKVYIQTPWQRMVYQTVDVRIVDPSDTDNILIQEGRDLITLVSCHPYVLGGGPERYLVYCERTTEEEEVANTDAKPEEQKVDAEKPQTHTDANLSQKPKEEDSLLVWETRLRKYVPPLTFLICGLLIFFRTFRRKK